MKYPLVVASVLLSLSLSACKDESASDAATDAVLAAESSAADASTPVDPAPVAEAPAEELTEEAIARAEQQARLDYATMEDTYINDPNGQWATAAKASSSFGRANDEAADSRIGYTPWQATGAPNGDSWNNNSQDIGFDWIELSYETPVTATEVRVVTPGKEAAESISKIELIDTDGAAHIAWSGLSDTRRDVRGNRTWIARKFEPTPYRVTSVKITFANNVASGYKLVDAVQLVGNQ